MKMGRRLRIAITGAGGRLGAALCREFSRRHQITPLTRDDLNLSDPHDVGRALERHEFDVLINTAAFTTVDECERDRDTAYDINAHAAGAMAAVCADRGARMVQVSTDFVFDGKASEPYAEHDPTNPINVYGQSKLLGEAKVLAACSDALVTRVSWVFGPDKPGFPSWLIKQVRELEEVGVPEDKVACPTYSLDYAAMLEPLLARPVDGNVLHLCNDGATTWFGYAEYIVETLRDLGVGLALERLVPTRSGDVKSFLAPRPPRTAMSTELYRQISGGVAPGWRQAVRRHVEHLFA